MATVNASHGQAALTPDPLPLYYTAVAADATAGGGASLSSSPVNVGDLVCYDPVQVAAGNYKYVTQALDSGEVDNRLSLAGVVVELSTDPDVVGSTGQTGAGWIKVAPVISGHVYRVSVKANASIVTPTPLGVVTGSFDAEAVTEGTALAYFNPTETADTSTTAALKWVIAR